MRREPVIYNKHQATVFDCKHNLIGTTEKRCAVCRIPLAINNIKVGAFHTFVEFCCDDCKDYWLKNSFINGKDLKIVNLV